MSKVQRNKYKNNNFLVIISKTFPDKRSRFFFNSSSEDFGEFHKSVCSGNNSLLSTQQKYVKIKHNVHFLSTFSIFPTSYFSG